MDDDASTGARRGVSGDLEPDRTEITAAIELVRRGVAANVRVSNLRQPIAVVEACRQLALEAGVDIAIEPAGPRSILVRVAHE